jgi:4-amino-4-deoxy-L-arabinose transferase-like glycosyltransferase
MKTVARRPQDHVAIALPPVRRTMPLAAEHSTDFAGWATAAPLLLGLIWFATLDTRSLIHPDEGRYAGLALEMARSGDWVTPRLNGLLYFEKPALGGLACYVVSVVVWIVALRASLSIAYPMLSIGYVVNVALAWWLFGEPVNAQRWIGIGVSSSACCW